MGWSGGGQRGGGGQGCIRRGVGGGSEGGWKGFALGPPSSQGPPVVPAEGGPNILKLQSSWHRRRRSKMLAVSLKHWKGNGEEGRRGPPPPLLRCTAVLMHMTGGSFAAQPFGSGGGGGGDCLRAWSSSTVTSRHVLFPIPPIAIRMTGHRNTGGLTRPGPHGLTPGPSSGASAAAARDTRGRAGAPAELAGLRRRGRALPRHRLRRGTATGATRGGHQGGIGRGSLRPAPVPLTPSAGLNGICNRQ